MVLVEHRRETYSWQGRSNFFCVSYEARDLLLVRTEHFDFRYGIVV